MKIGICRTGNLNVTKDGRSLAVIDPSCRRVETEGGGSREISGEVVYWDCRTSRLAIQDAVRDYLDSPLKGLNWDRYRNAIEGDGI
jgi:hypothetical protein